MEYRPLGRSGVKVSALCLGCMHFGGATDADDSGRIIGAARDAGINFLDTANHYNRGTSEQIVGQVIADQKCRDDVVLATKCSEPMGPGPNDVGSSRYHIMRECERSLRRLRTDRIDLYQMHFFDLSTPLEESLRALDDLVRQGKVLYTGTSKWAPAWLVEAIMLADRHGWVKFVSEQPPYNLIDRSIENELVWTCQRHGIGIIPWGPLGTGILSGKYRKDQRPPAGSRFEEVGGRLTPAAIDVADQIGALAKEKGVATAELSLAWVLRQPGVTAPIIGVRTMEHLACALESLEIKLTDADHQHINRVIAPGAAVSDYYDVNVFRRLRERTGLNLS